MNRPRFRNEQQFIPADHTKSGLRADRHRGYVELLSKVYPAAPGRENIDMSKVAGISISSLCPGLTALGENGEVLTDPIIYSDRRSTREAEMILEAVGREKLFEITANTAMAGAMSGTSMLWIKRNLPEVYEKTKYFGHVNTLLAQRMSGNFAMDHSNASYTDLFETTGGFRWSAFLCEKIGIDMEKLPPLHASTDVVGGLIHPDLIQMGIPRDTPIIIGGGDTACATLAAGVTKAGQVCESVGTTNVLTVCVDQPDLTRDLSTDVMWWREPGSIRGHCPIQALPTSGSGTTSVRIW